MFLTAIPADALVEHVAQTRPRSRFNVTSPQFQHKATMSLFGQTDESEVRKHFGVLFRVDTAPTGKDIFLVQSTIRPETLPQAAQCKEFEFPELKPGQRVVFRLAANTVTRTHREIVPRNELPQWLENKLQGSVSDINLQAVREKINRDKKRTVHTAVLDGTLVVNDPDAFIAHITNGIGRAKSYGCGLMSIRL